MTNKTLALLTMVNGYANITKKLNTIEDKLLIRLFNDILKFHSKLKLPKTVNVRMADMFYQKLKGLDISEFENKDFSSMVMVILLMEYLVNEARDTSLRLRFATYPFLDMIAELETHESFRKTLFTHHRVVSKMIEV